MATPATAVKRKEDSTGFERKRSPSVTPAREAWASVSPIMEYRRRTRNRPIQGQRTAMQREIRRAFCMKS